MVSNQSLLSFEFEQFKRLYYDEQQRRNAAGTKFAPTITILSAFCAIIGTILVKFMKSIIRRENMLSIYDILLSFPILINICSLIIAIVYFAKCFLYYKPKLISPSKLDKYFISLETYKDCYKEDELVDSAKKAMLNQYMIAAKINRLETLKHEMSLVKCYLFLIICLVSLVFSYIGIQFIK